MTFAARGGIPPFSPEKPVPTWVFLMYVKRGQRVSRCLHWLWTEITGVRAGGARLSAPPLATRGQHCLAERILPHAW